MEKKARQFLQEQIAQAGLSEARITLQLIGPKQPLPACRESPQISATDTRQNSRMRFVAQCAADNWREEFIVRAEVSAQVLVAATPLKAGEPIAEQALSLERRSLVNLAEALSDPAAVSGQSSKRALRAGQMLERRLLIATLLVRKGATVQIVAHKEGITASGVGQALEAGRRDEIIGVRNLSSGRLLRARVTGADEVEPLSSGMP